MDFDDMEFQESDLMFSWDYSSDETVDSSDDGDDNGGRKRPHCNKTTKGSSSSRMISLNKKSNIPKTQKRRIISSSAPVNIPAGNNMFRYDVDVDCSELFDEDYSDDNEEQMMVGLPPHLIVERRISGEMARSFSPLKGRNLCEVRDSILRKTGFLER